MSDRVLVLGLDHGLRLGAVMLALGSAGFTLVDPDSDRQDRRFKSLERIDMGEDILNDRPRDSMGFRHPHPHPRRELTFIDTPKRLSKRRARRLRGKVSA